MSSESSFFEKKIRPLFLYIGFAATIIFSIAYIIVIAVMITGLETAPTIETFVGFLVANLITGACIAVSLMIQGQDFAKSIPENQELLKKYYGKKDVKVHSMTWYWTWAIAKIIFLRLAMVAAMTYIVIDICWQGNGQYTYLLMALFNILMFVGFGFLGMVGMYDKYNEKYIPWLKKRLETKEEENKQENTQECLSMETKNSETSKSK